MAENAIQQMLHTMQSKTKTVSAHHRIGDIFLDAAPAPTFVAEDDTRIIKTIDGEVSQLGAERIGSERRTGRDGKKGSDGSYVAGGAAGGAAGKKGSDGSYVAGGAAGGAAGANKSGD